MNDYGMLFAQSIGYGFGIGAAYYIVLYTVVSIFHWLVR